MEFSQDFIEEIKKYLQEPWFQRINEFLKMYQDNTDINAKIEQIKEYVLNTLLGKFHFESSLKKFKESLQMYSTSSDFPRDEFGFVDYNKLLPINSQMKNKGLRTMKEVLSPNGEKYILKQAEAFKGPTAGLKNGKDTLYNPIMAQAVFTFLGENSSENLTACEKVPYYYILSKNFLQTNQECFEINDQSFMECKFPIDTNMNSIRHNQILSEIEKCIRNKYKESITTSQLDTLCNKLKLQYATQEVTKKLIKSMDENLGNTSIVVTKDEQGNMQDINISPAYDFDLSFLVGEELLNNDYSTDIFHRTGKDNKTDLNSIIEEFKEIPGFKEKLEGFINKFQGNYVQQILQLAYDNSKIEKLNEPRFQR